MDTDIVTRMNFVLGIFCVGSSMFILGCMLGYNYFTAKLRKKAVVIGLAKYNPSTGKFEWLIKE